MSAILSNLENSMHKNKFWNNYRSFCNDLHQEEIDIDHFISLLPKIFKQIEKNALSYQIYDAVNKLSEFLPNKGIELFNKLIKIENKEVLTLIPSTLDGISKSNVGFNKFIEAEFLLENNLDELKKQGYAFLITLKEEELNQNQDFSGYIYNLIKTDIKNSNTIFFSYIIRVLGKFITVLPEADENLISLSKIDSQEVLYEITRLLSYELDYSNNLEIYEILLFNLKTIDPKYHNIISLLNHLVFQKFIIDSPELIDRFLKEWLLFDKKRAGEIIKFSNTFEELHSKNSNYFKKMVTSWLNADDPVFHKAISKLIMEAPHYEFKNLELDENYLGQLNYKEIQFIVIKIVGYIYFKELIRSSIFSILKVKIDDVDCVNFIKAIFNEYIVFNYPSTIEYLEEEKKKSSRKVQKVVNEIIEINKEYFEKINQLVFINEFNPSDKRLKIYNGIHQKEFQIKLKETTDNKHSFLNMCKNIQLRTGKGMFSKHEGIYTEKTEMSRIQSSAELPRGEFIDAIGQEKIRAIYRNYTREI